MFDDPSIEQITAEDLLGDYPTVQYVRTPFEDLTVSVVSPRTLYLMTRDTGRLKDKADAALYRTMAGLWDTGVRRHGRRFTPGVYRFPTIQELEEAADTPPPSR